MVKPRIAIFIDAENIPAQFWREIADQAAESGVVQSCRAFGDFTGTRLGKWIDVARAEGLQPVMRLSGGKNSSDIAITVAAMDALHTGRLDAVYIATSDQDFAPLAHRLREGGLRVHGFGLANTPASLRLACTGFTVLGKKAAVKLVKTG